MIRRALAALFALCFVGVAFGQTYQPGRAPGFRPGFQFLGQAVVASAVKWTSADSTWTISSDGKTADRTGGSASSLVLADSYARTAGLAAFSIKILALNGTTMRVGLYPPGAATLNPSTTNRLVWRSDGVVDNNGTTATAAATFATGDILGFRLNAAGNSITLIKNGVDSQSYSVSVTSRCPAAIATTSGNTIEINGAPAGETPWG